MEVKTFEIRDEATFIPVLATCLANPTLAEKFLLGRTGFNEPFGRFVILTRLAAVDRTQYDPHSWGGRTMPVAHQYIVDNWNELRSGQVVDVEFILGETKEPKRSEAFL